MQRIERYGVLALVFLLVTLVTFALWDNDPEPEGDKLAKAGPAAEAPARQLSPAERQQREALRRREEATAELQRRKTQDAGKELSLKDQYQQGKNAADLVGKSGQQQGTKNIVRLDTPTVDGRKPAGGELVLGIPDDTAAARDTQARDAGATAYRNTAPATDSARETGADKARRDRERMDQLRRTSEHTVARGETLSQISQERLGTSRRWQEIVALNPGLDPNRLVVGQKIKLPGGGAAAADAPTSVAAQVEPAARSAGTGGSYTIRSGDVLSRIAEAQLGSVKEVQAILALNPGLDPNRLIVGQVIAMPQGASGVNRASVASAPRATSTNRAAASDRPRVR